MKTILMTVLLSMIGLYAFAKDVTQAPGDYTVEQRAEWNASSCKWRSAYNPAATGYTTGKDDRDECFALARWSLINISNTQMIGDDVREFYGDDVLVIYDYQDGHKEVCHIVPVKKPYDQISTDAYRNAAIAGGQIMTDFIKKLEANIELKVL